MHTRARLLNCTPRGLLPRTPDAHSIRATPFLIWFHIPPTHRLPSRAGPHSASHCLLPHTNVEPPHNRHGGFAATSCVTIHHSARAQQLPVVLRRAVSMTRIALFCAKTHSASPTLACYAPPATTRATCSLSLNLDVYRALLWFTDTAPSILQLTALPGGSRGTTCGAHINAVADNAI